MRTKGIQPGNAPAECQAEETRKSLLMLENTWHRQGIARKWGGWERESSREEQEMKSERR